jgi:hypothetical protein
VKPWRCKVTTANNRYESGQITHFIFPGVLLIGQVFIGKILGKQTIVGVLFDML